MEFELEPIEQRIALVSEEASMYYENRELADIS
jgi:hypothetical protein